MLNGACALLRSEKGYAKLRRETPFSLGEKSLPPGGDRGWRAEGATDEGCPADG